MDVLESALYQLRAHDRRLWPVRVRAVAHRTGRLADAWPDQDERRRAAAHLVVDALAVLASAGGLASDVGALIGEDGHVHEWANRYRSCTCGARDPAGAVHVEAGDLLIRDDAGVRPLVVQPATVHDTTDHPDPHVGPAAGAAPAADGRPGRRPRTDGIDYCSVHDLDGPCPYHHDDGDPDRGGDTYPG